MTQHHNVDLFLYDEQAEKYLDLRPIVERTYLFRGVATHEARGIERLIAFERVRRVSRRIAEGINRGGYDLAVIMQCRISNSPFVLRHLEVPSLYFCQEPSQKAWEPHFREPLREARWGRLRLLLADVGIAIDRSNARCATLILANSLYSRECIYRAYGVFPRVNYLGVNTELFRPLGRERRRTILCVGALNPAKAQEFVVESAATLNSPPRVRFIYNLAYGPTDYQVRLKDKACELGVDISFEHMVSDESLVEAYNDAVVVAFPSLLEPFGFVPLEAMACGTPVVGIAEGGIRETVRNGETGLLTERNPAEFGRAIETLMSNTSLWKRFSECGRETVVAAWTWKASYEAFERHLAIAREEGS